MTSPDLSVVTGALGYTGRYITRRLLSDGKRVRTLTDHPKRPNPFGEQIEIAPLDFNDRGALAQSMAGAATLYNTYWIRFEWGQVTFEGAVENTATLIRAAEAAGIRRVVHISIVGAAPESPLPYFRAKGLAEEVVTKSKIPYAIVRPTLIFGDEDVLINYIAWALRRFRVFPIFGKGDYPVQPVFVDDVAEMSVNQGSKSLNAVVDAAGPETYTFEELVRLIAKSMGIRSRLVHVSPGINLALTRLVGYLVNDVVLTRDEVDGLMAGLLVSKGHAVCGTRFSEWLSNRCADLGRRYASELRRHYR